MTDISQIVDTEAIYRVAVQQLRVDQTQQRYQMALANLPPSRTPWTQAEIDALSALPDMAFARPSASRPPQTGR